MSDFHTAVLIGRFQPFHQGHASLLRVALARAVQVILVLGSAHRARDAKNPFTWQERAAMIRASLDARDAERLCFVPVRDLYNDQLWQAAVAAGVTAQLAAHSTSADDTKGIALVGHHKDASSYYLQLFPHWTYISVPQEVAVDATQLRRLMFAHDDAAHVQTALASLTPAGVHDYLRTWLQQDFVAGLRLEHAAIEREKQAWAGSPYEPFFVTTDTVLKCGDQVLLVQRGRAPGKGLWALPGGFVEPRERLLQAAIRELQEETCIALDVQVLAQCLQDIQVFDHPDRSQRGRTITHAHFFDLGERPLPAVQGADDAALARWFPISAIAGMEEQMFEDHFLILARFLEV